MAGETGVRLEWDGKRDEKGNLRPVERVPLPFQTIETINLSRAGRQSLGRFGAKGDGGNAGWRNKLIWGDNRYVLETKGREDVGVLRKDARARRWCRDATQLTGQRWSYVKVSEDVFKSTTATNFCQLVQHALAQQKLLDEPFPEGQ